MEKKTVSSGTVKSIQKLVGSNGTYIFADLFLVFDETVDIKSLISESEFSMGLVALLILSGTYIVISQNLLFYCYSNSVNRKTTSNLFSR